MSTTTTTTSKPKGRPKGRPKTNAPYCGVEKTPSGRKKGSMSECAKLGQIRAYGLTKVDKATIDSARKTESDKVIYNKLRKKRTKLMSEYKKLENDKKKFDREWFKVKEKLRKDDPEKFKEMGNRGKSFVDMIKNKGKELNDVTEKINVLSPKFINYPI